VQLVLTMQQLEELGKQGVEGHARELHADRSQVCLGVFVRN
jgi:hypothetical protein